MVNFLVRKKWEDKSIMNYEGILEENVSACKELCKIETILKKRPKRMTQKQRAECYKKFDKDYVIIIY